MALELDLRLIIFACLCTTWSQYTQAEYFSAISEISRAVDLAQQISSDLNIYVAVEEERLERIRQLASRLSSAATGTEAEGNREEILGNPINAYVAMKRLTLEWKSDLSALMDDEPLTVSESPELANTSRLAQLLARVEQEATRMPGYSDLEGAAEALLRLQDTYQLKAESISKGTLIGNLSCPTLSAAQCLHLGQKAYDQNEYVRAEEWFRVAYNRLREELTTQADGESTEPDDSWEPKPEATEILDYLAYSLGRQGRYAEALNITKLLLEVDPTHEVSLENVKFYQSHIASGEGIIGRATKQQPLSPVDQETESYQAQCRGEVLFPPPATGTVYCRYYVPHPYYKIGPVKEEVLYPDPRIVMWYDVIHSSEIDRIQQLALPKLQRATVKNPVTGELESAFYRTSKSAWLSDKSDEVTHRINQRIHALTGLSMDTAEELQVGNYGIGGHYAPHFDFSRKSEKDAFDAENGNRIATIMFYLSQVKAGGATVFNRLGVRVNPVVGAAVFWYNLHPSGEGDLRTRHVACPVLVGSKWVVNVWFHERGQEFRRPCRPTPDPLEVDDGT